MNRNESVAILVDGGFFLKRYRALFDRDKKESAETIANELYTIAHSHLRQENHLYRIYYYDCIPFAKKVHNPISHRAIDFNKTPQALFRRQLFEELKKKRKVALRLGTIKDHGNWLINPAKTRDLLSRKLTVADLSERDVFYELHQKEVDTKIGVDIVTLALKKLVTQIVLISGDCDFVPASKLARREGIDFILDPMWNPIDGSLFEHIDGLRSTGKKPGQAA